MARLTLDHLGTAASTVCAVHCVLTGLALGLLSVAGLQFMASEQAEVAFVAVAVGIGAMALIHGHRRHHSLTPGIIFSFASVLLILKLLAFGHGQPLHDSVYSSVVSIAASAMLILFHVVNQKMQHRCGGKHCTHK
jgi:hypothetical protein